MDKITDFYFDGEIESSKSLMNRALIVKSYFPELQILGGSSCQDVQMMEEAVEQIIEGDTQRVDAGEGGAPFRFLLARLSRIPGTHFLQASPRLMSRPHSELVRVLHEFGVRVSKKKEGYKIVGKEWRLPEKVFLEKGISSQYFSSLFLNGWFLEKPLNIQGEGHWRSESYLTLTIEMLKTLGLDVQRKQDSFSIPIGAQLLSATCTVEPDLSSAFTVACFGALLGKAKIQNFPKKSLQPDSVFLGIFTQLGIPWSFENGSLIVEKASAIKGGRWDLSNSPDLFPVLAVVLGTAEEPSQILGVEHLVHKESNRIEKVVELLKLMGVNSAWEEEQFIIQGKGKVRSIMTKPFDPDQDHRMAMAGQLVAALGYAVSLQNLNCVKKSFPQFLDILETQ